MQLSLVPDITAVLLGVAAAPEPVASSLVQDIAIVLLSAGLAGIIFKKIGLSVIVGYLLAGVVIGPNTPIHMISDEARIAQLAQVGLVFVMFAIGLNLSLTKLAKMGLSTIFATALGAVFVFMLTVLLGQASGWSSKQSIFVAAMLMVSSSAVIAKIIQELHLSHNKTAQLALTITVMEDIVAVVMLTVLANVGASVPSGVVPDAESVGTAVAAAGGGDGVREMGGVFTKISSFVILILGL
ncbi:MAG: cation:proton antiporter, partial [Puniceicoccales bacterium]|nr:cation:proton antiporter [Puniceicoccales bacterium]